MEAQLLQVSGLTRRFGDFVAVNAISFHISRGETFGFLGPNGAGKTTSISMIAGLIAADSGTITVAGEPMNPRAVQAKAHLGLVPQDLAIYPDMSARENLSFFGKLQGMSGATRRARIDEVLEVVGLQDRAKEATKKFSGGMKRRLNIGIGLLHQPDLLILDEPTVGVDPQSRNAILEAVERLSGAGMAVLYTTHYMEEAERLCDRIAIMDSGTIQAEGTRAELIDMLGGVDRVSLLGSGNVAAAAAAIKELPAVEAVTVTPNGLEIAVVDAPTSVAPLVGAASAAGMQLQDVEITRPTLESVFLHLTGKALRD